MESIQKGKIKQNILPIGIIVLSVISLTTSIPERNFLSIIVSIMGLIGGYLYVKNGKPIGHWIELWLIAQIPYIDKLVFATHETPEYYAPIYDVSQFLKQAFYFHLSWKDYTIMIGLNVVPLIMIGILMYFKVPYLKTHHWIK
ncbi:MAG TPA: hypothetical protein PLE32_19990 [Haliscomenobacter sp.]|nr:hypothetical protein [Haliscomenobacter sp.]